MSTCTFSLHGDDDPGAGYLLNGTIVKDEDDTYVFDLTYDVTTMTSSYHWVMTGSLIVSDTTLDGLIHLDGSGTGPAGEVDWEIAVDYQGIQLGPSRCPRGGSIYTVSSYSSEGVDIYDIDGSLVFDLVCA
jgi:hypothetical protein